MELEKTEVIEGATDDENEVPGEGEEEEVEQGEGATSATVPEAEESMEKEPKAVGKKRDAEVDDLNSTFACVDGIVGRQKGPRGINTDTASSRRPLVGKVALFRGLGGPGNKRALERLGATIRSLSEAPPLGKASEIK
jgi:hypothetical protein